LEWRDLLNYRNGLVHGAASWPLVSGPPPAAGLPSPMPSVPILEQLPAGWAVGIVHRRLDLLHQAAGTTSPY
jgi:hypothetical protein